MNKYDFSGYATKNDLKCADGRIIRKDAFKECDGQIVPLVWQHLHNEPTNVLGHALLENKDDGVIAHCVVNTTPAGQNAKLLVQHGDITAMSIYANNLIQKSKDVIHGVIREVSLVLAGSNPGALIDNLSIAHADGTETNVDDEAIIYTGLKLTLPVADLQHADTTTPASSSDGETVADVFNTLNEKQKAVVYALVSQIMEAESSDNSVAQSAVDDKLNHSDKGDEKVMKKNVFDKKGDVEEKPTTTLTHDQFAVIQADAIKCGSFKEAFLAHQAEYGIENIDYLFPDARTVTPTPAMIQRRMEWVPGVIGGTYHSRFSRIKSLAADITADAARAKGYVKAALKKDEVISLLRRTTTPTTVYKKQKLDRDDIVDITDLDVVAWLKSEMRMMLDEELARAVLVGDGREAEDEDKIDETCLRPIWTDDEMYVENVTLADDATTNDVIDAIIRSRKNYNGSGSPVLYTTPDVLTDMLLLKATIDGRRMYATQAELEAALRVSKIVEVPVMADLSREDGEFEEAPAEVNLLGIIVNLKDYTMGADKGGEVNLFDDFDIDYNQYKYLIETRCSGALVLPKSAIVIEQVVAGA